MKSALITSVIFFLLAFLNKAYAQTTGTMKDPRDGQVYKTITVNGKSWMAQNLNYATEKGSCCYNDQKDFCLKYGRLYTWDQTDIACPADWHVPSDKEWQSLINYFGGDESAGTKLLKGGSSGFNASLGGSRNTNGEFYYVGEDGYYWSSTPASEGKAWHRHFNSGSSKVYHYEYFKENSHSVRCVQD